MSKASQRLSRRHLFTRTRAGGAVLLGLTLAGCGGDDSSGEGSGSGAPLIAPTQAAAPGAQATPTQAAKRGGSFQGIFTAAPATLDPYRSPTFNVKTSTMMAYSTLYYVEPAAPDALGGVPTKIVPDIADGLPQLSADGKTYTVKLKPNARFHAPLNRPVTAEDIVFSWQRFTGQIQGIPPADGADRLESLEAVRAVDAQSVVFSLKRANPLFQEILADPNLLMVMPKETGTAFDPAQRMAGTGPWLFESYTVGSVIKYKRNPQWHLGPDRPYFDAVDINIITNADTRVAQFLAGKLDHITVNALQLEQVKQQLSKAQAAVFDAFGSNSAGAYAFERVSEPRRGAPWTDIRVRRALSMALDRDALNEAQHNFSKLVAAGVPLKKRAAGIMSAGYGEMALDPREQPSIGKWYTYDPRAAKALLDEAGGGFETEIHYAAAHQVQTVVEMTAKFWGDIGVKVKPVVDDLNAVFFPKTIVGDFSGVALNLLTPPLDPMGQLQTGYGSNSSRNSSKIKDPKFDQLIAQYYSEPDASKRLQIIRDFQLYAFEQMYYIPNQAANGVPPVQAFQPNMRGFDKVSKGYNTLSNLTTLMWKDG